MGIFLAPMDIYIYLVVFRTERTEGRPQMAFLDKVARIRAELLGAASDMPAAQVVAAALPLMGIVPEPSWALLQMVDAIIMTMTGGGGSTLQAPAAAPAALYNWPVVGWCVGMIKARNTDARFSKTIDGQREKANFVVYYEIDDEEVNTVLRAAEHGGEEDGSWVLLEPAQPAAAAAAME